MVHRLGARPGALDEDAQIVLRRFLPDEFGKRFWAQCRIDILVPEGKTRSLADVTLPLTRLTVLPDLETGTLRRQYDPTRGIVRDGGSGTRVEGSFQKEWLLRALRDARMKEVLE